MNRAVSRFLACVAFSGVVGMSPARAADDARLPVPPQAKVEDSLGLIRDAYEADYQAAKESGEPDQLIAQLRTSAGQEADPVRKYALLVEAENVAATHDNYRKAVELLDARAELFRIDGLALKGDLLKRLAGPKVTADLDLCDQAMDTAREAMRSDRFGVASDAASLAVSIAKAIDREQKAAARKQRRTDGRNAVIPVPIGVELLKKATALQAQVTATAKSFEQYEAAFEKAKSTPDDPAVNAVIGSYLCFMREDWKAGLPALAKSNLPAFASLAADEIRLAATAGPMDPQQAFSLAGKWWSAAEAKGVSDQQQSAIKDHAAGFYATIVDRLESALEKKLATSRLRGVTPQEQRPDASRPVSVAAGKANKAGDGGMVLIQGGRLPGQSSLAGIEVLTFKIANTETTWREWQDVRDYAVRNGFDLETAGHGDGDAFPARGISWFSAVKWCNAKSLKESLRPVYSVNNAPYRTGESVPVVDAAADGYRLPTDAEWEWAARGGARSKGFGFSGSNEVNEVAWFSGNNNPNGPKPVATKNPNELALYDMTGNVWEWCWDALPSGEHRRFRSASYDDPPIALRVGLQHGTWPGNSGEDIGFRYARNVEQQAASASNNTGHQLLSDIKFVMEPGGAAITGYTGKDPEITIPPVIQGRPVIAIGREAFKDNVMLTRVVLPASVHTIGPVAFAGCSSLESITLPASLVGIGFDAFHSCVRLRTIEIPRRVSDIHGGGWCFLHSSELEAINVDPANATYTSVDGLLYDKNVTTLLGCPGGKKGTVVIPPTVKKINGWVFHGCNKLERIVIPASVTEIDEKAFAGCNAEQTTTK